MSKKAGHTKGDWRIRQTNPDKGITSILLSEKIEAVIYTQEDIPIEEHNANVNLIASAPKLLSALISLCSDVNNLDLCEAPKYALQAVAKATGEGV